MSALTHIGAYHAATGSFMALGWVTTISHAACAKQARAKNIGLTQAPARAQARNKVATAKLIAVLRADDDAANAKPKYTPLKHPVMAVRMSIAISRGNNAIAAAAPTATPAPIAAMSVECLQRSVSTIFLIFAAAD